MYKLKEKLNRQKGFTLVEMLIVVAIIAILVAVSIPLVGGALESARKATDSANVRAAKAETMLYFMGATDDELTGYTAGSAIAESDEIYYDAENGKLVKTNKPSGYGKSSEALPDDKGTPADGVIQVLIDTNGVFDYKWVQ